MSHRELGGRGRADKAPEDPAMLEPVQPLENSNAHARMELAATGDGRTPVAD